MPEAENIRLLVTSLCELRKSIINIDPKVDNRILDDAFTAYGSSLRKKPVPDQILEETGELARQLRKRRCLKVWQMLRMMGLSPKEAAHSIGVKAGYFSKVIDEDEEATLAEGTIRHLEKFVKQKARAVVQRIFDMSGVPVASVEACNGPSADVTRTSKKRFERRVVTALISAMAGQPHRINLPKGVSGVTIRVGEEPHSLLVIAAKAAGDKSNRLALAHEYDHLADHFRDKANELRKGEEPPELPKKWF